MRERDAHACRPSDRESASRSRHDRIDTRPDYRDSRSRDHDRHTEDRGDTYIARHDAFLPAANARKRARDNEDYPARDAGKRRPTDDERNTDKPKTSHFSDDAKATFINPLASMPRPAQEKWTALGVAYEACSSLISKGIIPNSKVIARISITFAQYMGARKHAHLAMGRDEAQLLRRMIMAIQWCMEQTDQCDAFGIATFGNALKAATEGRLFEGDLAPLKAAYAGWLGRLNTRQFDRANAREIANVGNALKAAIEGRLYADDQAPLKAAYAGWLRKINDTQLVNADAQEIASVGNALKVGLDKQLFDKSMPACRTAYQRLNTLAIRLDS